ncbi:MAG: PGPGW domain-containing protein [Porticoccaceae bacterium]
MPDGEVLLWLGLLSFATFIISLLSLPWLVAKIPADYFCHQQRNPAPWKTARPAFRISALILKNLLGWILLAGGILMLFLPGQGILTMAMGLILMDYPGKYPLERRIVRIPIILKGLNWLRKKHNSAPLKI